MSFPLAYNAGSFRGLVRGGVSSLTPHPGSAAASASTIFPILSTVHVCMALPCTLTATAGSRHRRDTTGALVIGHSGADSPPYPHHYHPPHPLRHSGLSLFGGLPDQVCRDTTPTSSPRDPHARPQACRAVPIGSMADVKSNDYYKVCPCPTAFYYGTGPAVLSRDQLRSSG